MTFNLLSCWAGRADLALLEAAGALLEVEAFLSMYSFFSYLDRMNCSTALGERASERERERELQVNYTSIDLLKYAIHKHLLKTSPQSLMTGRSLHHTSCICSNTHTSSLSINGALKEVKSM